MDKYFLQNGDKRLLEKHRKKRGKYCSNEKSYASLLCPPQAIFRPQLAYIPHKVFPPSYMSDINPLV